MNHAITFNIDVSAAALAGFTDEYIAQIWHIGQANPAEYGDKSAGELAGAIGVEIVRRWLAQQPAVLFAHQPTDYLQRPVTAEAAPAPGGVEPQIGQPLGGGIYAGIIRNADDTAPMQLILLPGEIADASHGAATEWAKGIDGSLPTRREQALLLENLPGEFEPRWYWSCEQHAADPSTAWSQTFYDGLQLYYRKSLQGRARAVRRLPI